MLIVHHLVVTYLYPFALLPAAVGLGLSASQSIHSEDNL